MDCPHLQVVMKHGIEFWIWNSRGFVEGSWCINLAGNKELKTKKNATSWKLIKLEIFDKNLINILNSQMDLDYNPQIKYARNRHWESSKFSL